MSLLLDESSFVATTYNQNRSTSIKEGLTIESYNNRRWRDLLWQSYSKIPEHYSYIKRSRHCPDDNAAKINIRCPIIWSYKNVSDVSSPTSAQWLEKAIIKHKYEGFGFNFNMLSRAISNRIRNCDSLTVPNRDHTSETFLKYHNRASYIEVIGIIVGTVSGPFYIGVMFR